MTVPRGVLEQIVDAYREARRAWRFISDVGRQLGMDERQYCDRYVATTLGPLSWTSSSTDVGEGLTRTDLDRAWAESADGGLCAR